MIKEIVGERRMIKRFWGREREKEFGPGHRGKIGRRGERKGRGYMVHDVQSHRFFSFSLV